MKGPSGNTLPSCFESLKRPSRPRSTSILDGEMKAQGLEACERVLGEHRPLSFYHLWNKCCHILSSHPPLSLTPSTWRLGSGQLQPRSHRSEAGHSGARSLGPRREEGPSTVPSSARYPSTTTPCAGEGQAASRQLSPMALIFCPGTKKPPFISAEKIMPCFQKGKQERSTLARMPSERNGKVQTFAT